jgi:hypothetical protein
VQDISPRREPKGEAVALAEGEGGGRHLEYPIPFAQVRAGDQQAVANAGFERQTPVLGVEISAYATAGGGVEHGDVRDMHDEHSSDP